MSNTNYRQQVKELQRQKRIGTWALARRAGITPTTLYNYLSDKSQMTAGNLAKVIDALNAIPDKSLCDKEL
jgi:transcriptional regulator with XRE-family HTH domain